MNKLNFEKEINDYFSPYMQQQSLQLQKLAEKIVYIPEKFVILKSYIVGEKV